MRIEEEKFLINRIYKDFVLNYPKGVSVDDLSKDFFDKKILLEFEKKEGTKVFDKECIEEINKTIPYIQRIIEKPRSFIKTIEEKVPVETAKRINSQAISRLSRDSNDWYARTFLTVKPKNIVSDLSEETLDLYENRFVKTLVDKVLKAIVERRVELENFLAKITDNSLTEYIDNRFGYIRYDKNDKLLKALAKGNEFQKTDGYIQELKDEIEKIKGIQRKLNNIKYSDFYNKLRKCKKISNPVIKTNIILFDSNYNRCYKLWNYLNNLHEEEDFSLEDIDKKSLDNYYFAYVFFNIIASMVNNNYLIKRDATIKYTGNKVSVDSDIIWEKDNVQLQLEINPKEYKFKFILSLKDKKQFIDKFELYTNYIDFEGKGRPQIRDITDDIIENLIIRDKKSDISSKYCVVSLDINACSIDNDFGEQLYRRFFNIGDNYSNKESNIEQKGNYKTGIIIVSPIDVRYNFLHIQRLLNAHILYAKSYDYSSEVCPICGSKKITKRNGEIECNECKHHISWSSCINCKEKHILWIKYIDDKSLFDETITSEIKNQPYYFQLMKYETIMGQYAISSFRLNEEVSGWKLKSICPKCGVMLGDTE